MSATLKNRKYLLIKRPVGMPTESDFSLVSEELSTDLKAGQILVKTLYTSFDPAMRIWMSG